MGTIKLIKEAINKGLLEDMRILNCFPKTDTNGNDIKKIEGYMYTNLWDYINVDDSFKTSIMPTIEYDIVYNSIFGAIDDTGYSAYFKITVPVVGGNNEEVSVDDLSEIILEIAKSKLECIRNVKNIPMGYDKGCVSRHVSFNFNSKE